MTHEEALEEIKRCSGTQFDPKVAKIFVEKSMPRHVVKKSLKNDL